MPCDRDRALLPYEIKEITEQVLNSDKYRHSCTPSYISSLQKFIQRELVEKLVAIREAYNLMRADERLIDEYGDVDIDHDSLDLGKYSFSPF